MKKKKKNYIRPPWFTSTCVHVLRKYLCCCFALCSYALCSVVACVYLHRTESIKNIKGRAVYPVCDGGAAAAVAHNRHIICFFFIFGYRTHHALRECRQNSPNRENLLMMFLRRPMDWKSQWVISPRRSLDFDSQRQRLTFYFQSGFSWNVWTRKFRSATCSW